MKKIFILLILSLFLSGCAAYRFHYGEKPYNTGYVASRDDYAIVEYTVGKDNSVPADLELAQERFKRRRRIVEHYYKKMGRVENNFQRNFWNICEQFYYAVVGAIKFPFIIVSEYRYEHNPEYRERIDRLEEEKDAREEARLQKLKDELNDLIQRDLAREEL